MRNHGADEKPSSFHCRDLPHCLCLKPTRAFSPQALPGTLQLLIQPAFCSRPLNTQKPRDFSDPLVKDRHTDLQAFPDTVQMPEAQRMRSSLFSPHKLITRSFQTEICRVYAGTFLDTTSRIVKHIPKLSLSLCRTWKPKGTFPFFPRDSAVVTAELLLMPTIQLEM